MAPSELRRQTLREMRKALLAMMSAKWDLALEGRSRSEVTAAARSLLAMQRARLRLRNAELREIREQLAANEAQLLEGTRSLTAALKKLEDVERLVEAATALARVVGRIVGLGR